MANGIRTGDPRGFNKRRSSKFREGSRVQQTPEESRGTYWPKYCGNNNKDEDNSPKTLNYKKQSVLLFTYGWGLHLGSIHDLLKILAWIKMHTTSPMIWTRVAECIDSDDNSYTLHFE